MRSFITKAGIVTALAAAAFIGPSVTGALAADGQATPAAASAVASAVASDPLGPFEQLSECLGRGNKGVEDGEWSDYECVGSPGAWYVQPIYN